MGRLFFALMVMVAISRPEIRERTRPAVDGLLAPVYEWVARARAGEIGRALAAEMAAGRPVPTSAFLERFLNERERRDDAGVDPWGTPYFLQRDMLGMRVVSAGRDRLPHTRDDLLSARVAPAAE